MRLHQILERVQEVTPHHYVAKFGNIFRVYKHNYDGVSLSDAVQVQPVKRMWVRGNAINSAVDSSVVTIRLSDGYSVLNASQALEIYQLQRGAMKSLAADAGESPNYIRQVSNIDS